MGVKWQFWHKTNTPSTCQNLISSQALEILLLRWTVMGPCGRQVRRAIFPSPRREDVIDCKQSHNWHNDPPIRKLLVWNRCN